MVGTADASSSQAELCDPAGMLKTIGFALLKLCETLTTLLTSVKINES